MDILSFTFIFVALTVIGFACVRFRSNWRAVQSMRAGNQGVVDEPTFDVPDGPNGSTHQGHGHDCGHHGGAGVAMTPVASTVATTAGLTEVAGIIKPGFLRDDVCQ
jgi:hypothetical protein